MNAQSLSAESSKQPQFDLGLQIPKQHETLALFTLLTQVLATSRSLQMMCAEIISHQKGETAPKVLAYYQGVSDDLADDLAKHANKVWGE